MQVQKVEILPDVQEEGTPFDVQEVEIPSEMQDTEAIPEA